MKQLYIIFFSLSLVLFFSCKKSTDEFVPYPNSDFSDTTWSASEMSTSKRTAMTMALKKPSAIQTFDASITSNKDVSPTTNIKIPANACILNNSVYTGNITSRVDEMLSKADFIRNLMPNCTQNNLQETIAAFNLNLLSSQNEVLTINNTNKISVHFNDGNFPTVGYEYYYGNISHNTTNWSLANASLMGDLKIANATIQGNQLLAYQINTNNLGLMSMSRKLNFTNASTANVVTPTNFTNKNSAVFAVLKNYNTVIQLHSNTVNKTFVANNLPNNEQITFVALSYLDDKFYVGFKEVVMQGNTEVILKTSTTPISIDNLNVLLNSL
jgi:hypothetical protein